MVVLNYTFDYYNLHEISFSVIELKDFFYFCFFASDFFSSLIEACEGLNADFSLWFL